MLHLLKIEWMKIKSYKVFQVFSILYAFSLLVTIYICYKLYTTFVTEMTGSSAMADMFNPFAMPNLWTNAAFFLGFLIYLPALIIINLCVNEFNFKTHRQNVIDGWKRSDFLVGKFLVILVFAVAITIIYILGIFVFCKLTNIEFSFDGGQFIFNFFLQTLTYLLMAFTLAILFRKSGIAIIVFFVYGLVIDNILWGIFENKKSSLAYFMPLQSSDALTPLMVKAPVLEKGSVSIYRSSPDMNIVYVTVIAFCLLYIFIAYKKFVKDDL